MQFSGATATKSLKEAVVESTWVYQQQQQDLVCVFFFYGGQHGVHWQQQEQDMACGVWGYV